MNRRGSLWITLAGSFLIAAISCAVQDNSGAEAEIRAMLDAQVRAWNQGDIEGFLSGYLDSPDLIFASRGTFARGWRPLLERYRKAYPEGNMGTLRFDDLEFFFLGEDAAWAVGTWWLESEDGSPHGAFTLIFEKTESGWKIVHDHSSGVQPGEND